MKKLLSLMLCIGAAAPLMSAAPTLVDLAKKAKTTDEARNYINQALEDPQLNQQAETYFVAGKIEFDAFDNGYKAKLTNPEDPAGSVDVLGPELLLGYQYFMKALPLDSVPNEKGQVKPKYSKDIMGRIKGHSADIFTAAADYYNEQKYYPEAYNLFIIYGDLPVVLNDPTVVTPEMVATSYFNAGLAAYQGQNSEAAAEGFKKARLADYEQPEATIYEIASWQTIAQNDESRSQEAEAKIKDAAKFGYEKFGIDQPIFIINYINSMVNEGQMDQAVEELNEIIAQHPDSANLYGLMGFVYDRMENDELSEANYRKAASLPTVDFETLKNSSTKLFKVGTEKLSALEGNSDETNAARQDIKNNYFQVALDYANRANEMQPGDPKVQSLLDSIDYALTTYFKY